MGKRELSKFHDPFRLDLRAVGYDATMDRVDGGKKGVSVTQFKRDRTRERQLDAKVERFEKDRARYFEDVAALEAESKEASKVSDDLDARTQAVNSREEEITEKELDLTEREDALKDGEAMLSTRQLALDGELRRMRREAEDDAKQRWLDKMNLANKAYAEGIQYRYDSKELFDDMGKDQRIKYVPAFKAREAQRKTVETSIRSAITNDGSEDDRSYGN